MDGLVFVRSLLGTASMPMAEHFDFVLDEVTAGSVRGSATPASRHQNPFGVAQGGFASTVLDIALGLASISVLSGESAGVMTLDLDVRFVAPIYASTGTMEVKAEVIHAGQTIVVGEARLFDRSGKLYAVAQSTSIVARE
jgi:uncharacterized protein (TIGR00369 family)